MKRNAFIGIAALAIIFSFAACKNPNSGKNVESITVNPVKIEYKVGEKINRDDVIVTAKYDDGSTGTVTGYKITGFNNKKTGLQLLTVSYGGSYEELRVTVLNNNLVKMAEVLGGKLFTMGTELPDESPEHQVIVTCFYMGKYQVTQTEYQAVMGNNPSAVKGINLPVTNVSWYDAVEFCNKLSVMEGLTPPYTNTSPSTFTSADGYRLATEAEWEYAAKGGPGSPGNFTYSGSNIPNDVAWFNNNSGNTIRPVGTKIPNGLGIYDMSGNVSEWCWDWHGTYTTTPMGNPKGPGDGINRITRGGNYSSSENNIRSANREKSVPGSTSDVVGFRVVRTRFPEYAPYIP